MNKQILPLLVLLAASGLALLLTMRTLPPRTFDAGTPGDTRFLSRFSIPETGDDTTFRWSMKDSRLMLHGTTTAGSYSLHLRMHGDNRTREGDWSVNPGVEREGSVDHLAHIAIAPGWRVYRVLVPPGTTAGSDMQPAPLLLEAESYRRIAGDNRDLGVALDRVHVAPLAGDDAPLLPALWHSLVYTWLLGVVAALVWQGDRALFRGRSRSRVVRVVLVAGLCALALVGWAYTDPYTLAWALPPMPWILALVSLLLLVLRFANHPPPLLHHSSRFPVVGVAVALLLVAQAGLHLRLAVGAGIVLAFVGVALLALTPSPSPEPEPEPSAPRSPALPLALIVVLALALRFYHLDSLPYGLWRDEASHGLVALRILEEPAYRPVYVAGVNLPAAGLYPFALALKLWGIHHWSMRPITALAGALTVLPLYGVVMHLTGQRRVALLAAALLAVSSWHITISRFSFPTIFDPLLTLTAVWLLLRGLDAGGNGTSHPPARVSRVVMLVLAGIGVGLATQTYHTGRLAPALLALLAVLRLFRNSRMWKRWLAGIAIVALSSMLTVAPLASYALHNPDAFNRRVGRVFLLREAALYARAPLAVLDDALGRHLAMFNLHGDSNGRHHAPNRPMLDFITGLGFLAGCGFLLHRWRNWQYLFLLAALAVGLLPSLLAVQGPHGMRSIHSTAFACTIAAVGWVGIVQYLASSITSRHARLVAQAGMVVVVAGTLGLNAWVYFVTMPVNPSVWLSYYPIHTQVGSYVREYANQHGTLAVKDIYVPDGLQGNAVFDYLTHTLPVSTFDDGELSRPPAPGAQFVLSGYTWEQDAQELAPYLGKDAVPILHGPMLPGRQTPSYVVYATTRLGDDLYLLTP